MSFKSSGPSLLALSSKAMSSLHVFSGLCRPFLLVPNMIMMTGGISDRVLARAKTLLLVWFVLAGCLLYRTTASITTTAMTKSITATTAATKALPARSKRASVLQQQQQQRQRLAINNFINNNSSRIKYVTTTSITPQPDNNNI